MEKQIFTNDIILSWLQYYSQNTPIDLEHVKIIDITKKIKMSSRPSKPTRQRSCLQTRESRIFFTACGTQGLASVRYGTMRVPTRAGKFFTIR